MLTIFFHLHILGIHYIVVKPDEESIKTILLPQLDWTCNLYDVEVEINELCCCAIGPVYWIS